MSCEPRAVSVLVLCGENLLSKCSIGGASVLSVSGKKAVSCELRALSMLVLSWENLLSKCNIRDRG
jgi:hypothetical protein